MLENLEKVLYHGLLYRAYLDLLDSHRLLNSAYAHYYWMDVRNRSDKLNPGANRCRRMRVLWDCR